MVQKQIKCSNNKIAKYFNIFRTVSNPAIRIAHVKHICGFLSIRDKNLNYIKDNTDLCQLVDQQYIYSVCWDT